MDFNGFQEEARRTAIYPDRGSNLSYPVLGLCGETGEVANEVKRVYRDDDGKLSPARRKAISSELGDALWYLALVADEAGLSLAEVANGNLEKLRTRQAGGTLHGEGEER
jgi:NTP pyrophosphatase (non-canonical NTP hydrolase)